MHLIDDNGEQFFGTTAELTNRREFAPFRYPTSGLALKRTLRASPELGAVTTQRGLINAAHV